MEESSSSSNQRLIIAAVASLAVLLGWNFLFPQKRAPRPVPQQQQQATGTATLTASATRAAAVAVEPAVHTASVAGAPDVKPQLLSFEGSVYAGDERPPVPFHIELTNVGGGIERFELPSFKERDVKNEISDRPITLATPAAELGATLLEQMGGISFVDGSSFKLPDRPVYQVVESTEHSVRYRFVTATGIEIEREYQLKKDSFEIELAVTVRNHSRETQKERLEIHTALGIIDAVKATGGFLSQAPDHLNAVCYTDGKVKRDAYKSLQKEAKGYKDAVKWVGMDRQYFVAAVIQRDGADAECRLSASEQFARAALVFPESTLRPGEEKRHKMTAYLGVKKPELLTKVDSQLEAAIDYTIWGLNLAILAQGLIGILGLIHRATGSWGLAILGLTVLVKLVLFPLNQRSGRSMRAMAALKPEMDSLKERFADDRQRQSEEMMKLYKTHNVNPASGCVPVLLQMPIWFALYRALWVSVDLYQQSFLWLPDLTARDPYYVLPVLLVSVMFVQQKMTPSTMDPAQQKMMLYVMPLIFGTMMMALPGGLCFYILVNSLLTIVQQYLINRSIGPIAKPAAAAPT